MFLYPVEAAPDVRPPVFCGLIPGQFRAVGMGESTEPPQRNEPTRKFNGRFEAAGERAGRRAAKRYGFGGFGSGTGDLKS